MFPPLLIPEVSSSNRMLAETSMPPAAPSERSVRNALGSATPSTNLRNTKFPVKVPTRSGAMGFQKSPVAIVGARKYIFSEGIGILGDLAAGKDRTSGTLTTWLGGKLRCGHPGFLNTIYTTSRGLVSKVQKGLHLNKDIYAGMNALGHGGRIKHTECYKCGKGRNLDFGTILNLVTKIVTGMGEQMLSGEEYYLGSCPSAVVICGYLSHSVPPFADLLRSQWPLWEL